MSRPGFGLGTQGPSTPARPMREDWTQARRATPERERGGKKERKQEIQNKIQRRKNQNNRNKKERTHGAWRDQGKQLMATVAAVRPARTYDRLPPVSLLAPLSISADQGPFRPRPKDGNKDRPQIRGASPPARTARRLQNMAVPVGGKQQTVLPPGCATK